MEFRTLFLLLCFCLVQGFASAALDVKKGEQDNPWAQDIDVEFVDSKTDETSEGYLHWSSAKRFNANEDTVRDALPSLARQAYEEMIEDAKEDGDLPPSTMAALAVGSDVYFSSSLKGGPFLVSPGAVKDYVNEGVAEEVRTAIIRCQHTYQSEHRYNANCAEPLAAQQYLVNNPGTSIVGIAKVSTYGIIDDRDSDSPVIGIINPCGMKDGKWGCQIFIDKLSVTRVGTEGDNPGLPTIQPSGDLPHCFWT